MTEWTVNNKLNAWYQKQYHIKLPKQYQTKALLYFTTAYAPSALFSLGEQGVWFDPSDVANLNWRRNLLTYTEQFDNAVWGTGAVANGSRTNGSVSLSTDEGYVYIQSGGLTLPAGTYTFSADVVCDQTLNNVPVRLSAGAGGVSVLLNMVAGVSQRISLTVSVGAFVGTAINFGIDARNAVVPGGSNSTGYVVTFNRAQYELGSTATDYQRITDVNTEVIERFPNATLYQDTAGTQPVTTTGQSVGLMLDKSKGLVLGPERVSNGSFDGNSAAGWFSLGSGTALPDSYVVDGALQVSSTTNNTAATAISTVSTTTTIRISFNARRVGAAAVELQVWCSQAFGANNVVVRSYGNISTDWTSYTMTFVNSGVDRNRFAIREQIATGGVIEVDNISVKELPGNHAVQATTANRPIYGIHPFGGRRNLGLMTSMTSVTGTAGAQVPNATGWSSFFNTGGTRTYVASSQFPGDQALDISGVTTARNVIGYSFTPLASTTYTVSFWIESLSGVTGTVSYVTGTLGTGGTTNLLAAPLSTGRASYTFTTGTSPGSIFIRLGIGAAGDESGSIRISGFQVEVASTATNYQRVTDQYNVTEAGVPSVSYLFFDGVNDGMVTPTITPGVDKAQVFVGIRKLSDATGFGLIAEMSPSTGQPGTLGLFAPATSGTATYHAASAGGGPTSSLDMSTYVAPSTNVVSVHFNNAGATRATAIIPRVNGITPTISGGVDIAPGGGNFLAYPLYIGRRGGSSLPLNGHLYGLIARFGPNLATGQISSTETWVASRTGITI